jgi:hypothetical protein
MAMRQRLHWWEKCAHEACVAIMTGQHGCVLRELAVGGLNAILPVGAGPDCALRRAAWVQTR